VRRGAAVRSLRSARGAAHSGAREGPKMLCYLDFTGRRGNAGGKQTIVALAARRPKSAGFYGGCQRRLNVDPSSRKVEVNPSGWTAFVSQKVELFQAIYSYRSASIGSSRAARRAGK
jgi:hypothetical protein